MKIIPIELEKNPNHINPFLTHWTGREKSDEEAFSILEKIINGKKLRFGENNTSFPDADVTTNNLMVCFTDTPIEQSVDLCKIYNSFGISFNKKSMMDYGANPVLYVVPQRKKYLDFYNKEHLKGVNVYHFKNQDKMLYGWFSALNQPYHTPVVARKGFAEYLEREWRIIRVLPSNLTRNIIKREGPFEENLVGEVARAEEDGNIVFYLMFSPDIIENIIVPKHYQEQATTLLKENNINCDLLLLS